MQIQTLANRSLVRARHLRARHLPARQFDFERRPDSVGDLFAAVLMLLAFLMAAILV